MNRLKIGFVLVTALLLFPLSTNVFAAGDAGVGKTKSTQCTSCHGVDGKGNGTPKSIISGMDVGTFSKHINDFKNGARKNMMMEMFAKKLSDQDIADLAAYFATQ